MSRKQVLSPIVISAAQSLAANFTTAPTVIDFQDNCSYQINVTTTNSTGTFAVQASLDFVQADANHQGVAGNWITLTLGGGTPSVNAANDSIIINLNQLPFRGIRLQYTSTIAGTGTANIILMCKTVGA